MDECGREVCRGRGGGGGVIRMSLLFSCLSYRMRPGEHRLLVSWKHLASRLVSASRLFRLGVRLVGASRFFLSCERLVMASRRWAVPVPFVFFCLCVLLVAMIDGSCRSVCLVSRFAFRLVLSVPFFFLIVIGAGSGERGGAVGSGRGSLSFLWRGRSIPALRLARRGEGRGER